MSENIYGNALQALEAEAAAAAAADAEYLKAKAQFETIEAKYREVRGVGMSIGKAKDFIANNKGTLIAVATAFGLPVGFADTGAFRGVLDLGSRFLSLFGIG
jgi:hypothetical protein